MTDVLGWAGGLRTLIGHLGAEPEATDNPDLLLAQLATVCDAGLTDSQLWATWSILKGELPTESELIRFRRNAGLNGAARAISDLGGRAGASMFGLSTEVEIASNVVLVDVHHTSSTIMRSGVQRVVREAALRWGHAHDVVFVSWTDDEKALRRLTVREEARMRGGDPDASVTIAPATAKIVIPLTGLMIVPELATDAGVAERLLAMGRFSAMRVVYIGYDCVPLTSGETTDAPIAANFPLYLDAVSYGTRVATISESTALEFRSWKKMLPSSGRVGPDVRTVFLGGDTSEPTAKELAETKALLKVSDHEPMILAVGSHEPRKNHLALLQAARILWERGEKFRLVLIGSSSWGSGAFDALATVLKENGRPLVVLSNASDAVLASSYRLARVSVFTSFHEGFGLPIVESLRAGTPVIASNVGSMLEISHHYGGVISVDPHSDNELEGALLAALHDPAVLDKKRRDLAANSYVSWDDYADELWAYFTEA
ncbi:glycosyltransferase family 4 protein [Subtercola frigoramans]|uniref:Glycosyltransferase involved in cell wall biosynthesis n=1 Tax=Subtercola frigoramans TaxID=120298 RepID=A0ABS2L874_9MICO|nr:glycosyltransferase family 1 protein [Subtercola frigoramans]MBM7473293.1 glycosyltransferase involved in cell wall biosynthesis [Subtercola frigoramans]